MQASKTPIVLPQVMSPTEIIFNYFAAQHCYSIHFVSQSGPWSSLTNVVDQEIQLPTLPEIQAIARKHEEAFNIPKKNGFVQAGFMQDLKALEIVQDHEKQKKQQNEDGQIQLTKVDDVANPIIHLELEKTTNVQPPNVQPSLDTTRVVEKPSEQKKPDVPQTDVQQTNSSPSKKEKTWAVVNKQVEQTNTKQTIHAAVDVSEVDKTKKIDERKNQVYVKARSSATELVDKEKKASEDRRKTCMCKFGDQCTRKECHFAHSIRELLIQEVPSQFKQNKCTNVSCGYGHKCNYWHGETERSYNHCENCVLLCVDGKVVSKICRIYGEARTCSCK